MTKKIYLTEGDGAVGVGLAAPSESPIYGNLRSGKQTPRAAFEVAVFTPNEKGDELGGDRGKGSAFATFNDAGESEQLWLTHACLQEGMMLLLSNLPLQVVGFNHGAGSCARPHRLSTLHKKHTGALPSALFSIRNSKTPPCPLPSQRKP